VGAVVSYSPFRGKSLADLEPEDLQYVVSDGVCEGYTIEYKERPVDNQKLSRSIASFANQMGGWYVVGVKTDKHNRATEICGFEVTNFHDYLSTIRDVTLSRIRPVPYFEARLLEVGNDRVVAVVHVADEQTRPS
jgi:predicted HTH transcriptional regulator